MWIFQCDAFMLMCSTFSLNVFKCSLNVTYITLFKLNRLNIFFCRISLRAPQSKEKETAYKDCWIAAKQRQHIKQRNQLLRNEDINKKVEKAKTRQALKCEWSTKRAIAAFTICFHFQAKISIGEIFVCHVSPLYSCFCLHIIGLALPLLAQNQIRSDSHVHVYYVLLCALHLNASFSGALNITRNEIIAVNLILFETQQKMR